MLIRVYPQSLEHKHALAWYHYEEFKLPRKRKQRPGEDEDEDEEDDDETGSQVSSVVYEEDNSDPFSGGYYDALNEPFTKLAESYTETDPSNRVFFFNIYEWVDAPCYDHVSDLAIRSTIFLHDYFLNEAERTTVRMYKNLMNDPDKVKSLPADFKDKIISMLIIKHQRPDFKIRDYDQSLMQWTFECIPPFNPYHNLKILRNMETGQPIAHSIAFDDSDESSRGNSEDRDERIIKFCEKLPRFIASYPSNGGVLRKSVRDEYNIKLFEQCKSDMARRLDPFEIRSATECIAYRIEWMKLVEERYRIIKYLWRSRVKGKYSSDNLRVCKRQLKLRTVETALIPYTCKHFPTEEQCWETVPVEERADLARLEARLDQECKEAMQIIEESIMQAADYAKQKKKVAEELGLWKVPLDALLPKLLDTEVGAKLYPIACSRWSRIVHDSPLPF